MKQIFLVAMVTFFLSMFAGNNAKAQGSYCTAGSDNNFSGIGYVGLNTISNSSGLESYQDFTALSTNLVVGSMSNSMHVTVWPGDAGELRLTVFIDFNHDYDFNDPGETIYAGGSSPNDFNLQFNVPASSVIGATRMRVRSDFTYYNANNTPCGNSYGGEVEDYTVNIVVPCTSTTSTTHTSICASALPYIWNGKTFTTAGSDTVHLTNTGGCDSVATLNLALFPNTSATQIVSSCKSYRWSKNNQLYPVSGVYTYISTNKYGCADTAILNLTVTPLTSVANITRCASYLWNGVTYNTAGTYTYRSTTAAGCDSIATLNLRIVPSGTDVQNVTSCTPYTWNGVTYKVSGTYNTTISAAGGCKIFATLKLTVPVLTATITTTVPTCVNTATATLTVTNSNGTAPYLYKNGLTGAYQTSNVFTGLRSGIPYRIYWQDANGCTGNSDLITIAPPVAIAVSTSSTSPTCFGQKNATITASAANGVAGYMYKNGSTGTLQSSPTFTGLLAGVNYRIYAQDATGCTGFSDLVNVPQTPAIAATFTTSDATCFNTANGTATISASGGSGTYQYKNGTAGTLQTSNVLTGLRAGTQYRAYVVDNNGCTGNTTLFMVGQPAALTSVTTVNAPVCVGNPGSASITPTTGTPPYQYKYSATGVYQQFNTFDGINPGTTFRLYFQDATGCVGIGDQQIMDDGSDFCNPDRKKAAIAKTVTAKHLEVVLSPNPSSSQFTLIAHSGNIKPITIRVLDVNGKNLYITKGQPEQSLRFGSSFGSGLYFVEVRQGDEVKTVKAVKL